MGGLGHGGLLLDAEPTATIAEAAQAGAPAASAGLHARRHPWRRWRSLAGLMCATGCGGLDATLNVPIAPTRRFALVRVPSAELESIGHELGASVNNVVLAAFCAGCHSNAATSSCARLRTMAPINVRDAASGSPSATASACCGRRKSWAPFDTSKALWRPARPPMIRLLADARRRGCLP